MHEITFSDFTIDEARIPEHWRIKARYTGTLTGDTLRSLNPAITGDGTQEVFAVELVSTHFKRSVIGVGTTPAQALDHTLTKVQESSTDAQRMRVLIEMYADRTQQIEITQETIEDMEATITDMMLDITEMQRQQQAVLAEALTLGIDEMTFLQDATAVADEMGLSHPFRI